jgi:hypothetical protein
MKFLIFLLSLIPFVFSSCDNETATPVDLTTGLAAKYMFNSNLKDDSGNNFDGTLCGDASYSTDRFGVNNKSLLLDGNNDYVCVADNDLLDIGNDDNAVFSISLWFKSAGDNGQRVNWIIGKGITQSSAYTDYGFAIHNDVNYTGEHMLFWLTGPGTDDCANSYYDLPENNLWHHVVLVLEAQTAQAGLKTIYIDGKYFSSCEYSEKTNSRGEDLLIGAGLRPDGGIERFFNGNIDDIYIYRRALTEVEVLALFKISEQ